MSDLWFAWHPVRLTNTGKWAWLKYVHRVERSNDSKCSETHRSWWEYWS